MSHALPGHGAAVVMIRHALRLDRRCAARQERPILPSKNGDVAMAMTNGDVCQKNW